MFWHRAVLAETRLAFREGSPSCKWRLTSVRTSGTSLGSRLALIAADLQRRHVLRELQRASRPRLHMLLHCFLVLAQGPALGEPIPGARSDIHEYADLPLLEGAAIKVPAKQFLNESIELRQDFVADWFPPYFLVT